MSRKETLVALLSVAAVLAVTEFAVASCPFCPPAQPTISEQLQASELAVLAKWEQLIKQTGELEGADPQTVFAIVKVLLPPRVAEPAIKPDGKITVSFQRDGKPGELLLLLRGNAGGETQWTIWPVDLETSYEYVRQLPSREEPAEKRLSYFLKFLEFNDPFIANDAFAEFTLAKYQDVAQLAPKFSREKIREWLNDKADVKLMRHGFYGMLLGLCGNQDDAAYLRERIFAPPVPDRPRLEIDGMMAGYVLLTGERGLKEVVDAKLRAAQRDEGEVMSVMNMLRFLWEYASERVPRTQAVAAMRLLLGDVKYAETAIIDLARWKDWEITPQLLAAYGKPPFEERTGKGRVVQFALTAQKHLAEEEKRTEKAEKLLVSIREFICRLRRDEPDIVKSAERFVNPPPAKTERPRNQLEGNLDVRPAGSADRNP